MGSWRKVALVGALVPTYLVGPGGSSPAAAYDGGAAVVLTVWYQTQPTAGDRMTSSLAEANVYTNEGAIAYVSAGSEPGFNAVRRFRNTSTGEHRDCTCTSLPGFVSDGIIGYVGGSSTGTEALVSGFSGSDGATYRSSDPLPGYTLGGIPGYGYPRFDNDAESILSISAGGTTVESNLVTGGAVWRWTADGVEYLDQADYGRLMQSALFFTDSSTTTFGTIKRANPNEAGDRWGPDPGPAFGHGSPVVSASNTSSTTQSTRAIPLDWAYNYPWGGDASHPVLWRDIRMGKDLTLDFMGMDGVAQYDTVLTLPGALNTYHHPLEALRCPSNLEYCPRTPTIEIPTGYLDADYHYFSGYDAGTQTLSTLNPTNGDQGGLAYNPPSKYGGVILADSTNPTTSHAMGVYGVHTSASPAGSVSIFRVFDLRSGPTPAFPTTKWQADHEEPLAAGTTTFSTWVITGSVDDVVAGMDALYAAGVH